MTSLPKVPHPVNLCHEYRRLLEGWVPSAMQHLFTPYDRPDLRYYGDGTNGWGMQTVQKAFGAFAVLAADPDLDEQRVGMPRRNLRDLALALLRYVLASHLTGEYHTTDADDFRWGHTWISALGTERMMHGVEALRDALTPADNAALRAMLISESTWLLDEYPVTADPIDPNHPESNMWNGAVMLRTVQMYPDAPRADAIREKATRFLLNAISIPSDRLSKRLFDGRPLSEWHVGANFFESYGCNHHGYLNIGYMVITLSNLAMLHFSFRNLGVAPPEALYLHFEKLWQLVRMCLFDDGRLNRIGGDTRVRYCYCQDYLVPVLLLAADALGEDCAALERGWLEQVRTEVEHNGDGSFLSRRCELLADRSPLYYTRLESDRAVTLSYGALWRRLYSDFKQPTGTGNYQLDPTWSDRLGSWHDDYHGSCYVRTPGRMASFTWFERDYAAGDNRLMIDGNLAVLAIYGGKLELHRPAGRQIGIRGKEIAFPGRGMLHCDEVCIPLGLRPRWYDKDETIFDFGVAATTNGRFPQAAPLDIGHPDLRGVRVTGADGRAYRVVVNFGREARNWKGTSLAPCTAKVI